MLISDAFIHKGSASIRQRMEFKNNLIIFLLLIGGYKNKEIISLTSTLTVITSSTQSIQITGSTSATAKSTSMTVQTASRTTSTPATTTVSAPKTNDAIDDMVLPSVQREVAGVEIYFREGPSLSSAPVFNVYLGDVFYMFIRYTGMAHVADLSVKNRIEVMESATLDKRTFDMPVVGYHVIKPVECKAYAGVVIDKNVTSMVLWNSVRCSTVSGILEDFKNETNTLLSATLYGFQFHQSPYVTIECTVRICNPNTYCANETKLCQHTPIRRMMAHDPSSLGKGSFHIISGARNIGRPKETSSVLLYTFCWMLAFVIYIQNH